MNLTELKEILERIPGFEEKIVYNAWPVNEAPELPFIVYLEKNSDNFFADGIVYEAQRVIDIELYTRQRDTETERDVEETLRNAGIAWGKDIEYISSEKCYMIIYSTTI